MDVLVYSRDAAGSGALREDPVLGESHWSYMDDFAASMIARGPTLDTTRETATGSLHVLALPDADSVREFVAREPNNLAGVYAEHRVWRFENLLGRSMWEFDAHVTEPRFLIIARSPLQRPVPVESLPAELRERLIVYGALSDLEDGEPAGIALVVQAADRRRAAELVESSRSDRGAASEVEIHDWEPGGRR